MTVSSKSLKILWARSAGRCALCRCELAEAHTDGEDVRPLGETAHIVSSSPQGPRGIDLIPRRDRDSYHNLILLCPTHHREVDKEPRRFPSEKLFIQKSMHEHWVARSLKEGVGKESRAMVLDYDPQDVENLLQSWLEDARKTSGPKTVRFRDIDVDLGLDAGSARDRLPEVLREGGIEVRGVGAETIRFVIPPPRYPWASAGRRPLAGGLDDW